MVMQIWNRNSELDQMSPATNGDYKYWAGVYEEWDQIDQCKLEDLAF